MSSLSNDLTPLSINEGTHSRPNLPLEIIVEIVLELFETQWDAVWTATSVCGSWQFAALNVIGRLSSRTYIPFGTMPSSLALPRFQQENRSLATTWGPNNPTLSRPEG